MKKSIAILAVCATALSPILAAPAFAVPVFDPPAEVVTAEMTSGCAAYLADLNFTQSPRVFTAVATAYVGNEVTVDPTPFSSVPIPGTVEPVGPQTGADASGVSTANLANGKSPNIFVSNAKAVYAGGSTFDTLDTFRTTIVHTYSCTPTERIPGMETERLETQGECASRVAREQAVPGQFCLILSNRIQVTVQGPATFEVATDLIEEFDTVPVNGTATDTGVGFDTNPYTDPDSSVQAVVCVSPVKSTGLWKKVNLYTGECSRALYDRLNVAGTPSNSLPAS